MCALFNAHNRIWRSQLAFESFIEDGGKKASSGGAPACKRSTQPGRVTSTGRCAIGRSRSSNSIICNSQFSRARASSSLPVEVFTILLGKLCRGWRGEELTPVLNARQLYEGPLNLHGKTRLRIETLPPPPA